jgi:8-oxo-dGTP diphosphatase
MEPDKCVSWEWVRWEKIVTYYDEQNRAERRGGAERFEGRRLFLPLLNLFKQRSNFEPSKFYYYGLHKIIF